MNKDTSKSPVPEDRVEKFMTMVSIMADMCGIDEVEEVAHFVDLLAEAVARYKLSRNSKVSPQKKVSNDRKRFIAIFKTRYAQMMDIEYSKKITPTECKLINQANKLLKDKGFLPDDFLAWLFDEFLVENPNFRPPTIKSICSQFILHSFLNENRELSDARRRQKIDQEAGMDLIQRARVLMRGEMEPDDLEKLKEAVKAYGERGIMLGEFRRAIEALESKVKKGKN